MTSLILSLCRYVQHDIKCRTESSAVILPMLVEASPPDFCCSSYQQQVVRQQYMQTVYKAAHQRLLNLPSTVELCLASESILELKQHPSLHSSSIPAAAVGMI